MTVSRTHFHQVTGHPGKGQGGRHPAWQVTSRGRPETGHQESLAPTTALLVLCWVTWHKAPFILSPNFPSGRRH